MLSISQKFSVRLLDWFDQFGRKNLPWQHPRTAYRVWVSEIMLQQTQVKTAIPYFNRFLDRFPDIEQLAHATEDEVFACWSGLGYYSRARNLHKAASIIQTEFQGEFPSHLEQLLKLPGIGPSTAAAICSLAFNQPTAILDGNVKRILSRYFLIDGPLQLKSAQQKLWQFAEECMPHERCTDYTQAIMDFGATCCTPKKPQCSICPFEETCLAKIHNVVANYPYKSPKKTLPRKQQQFLLLHTRNDLIYLEKRPPTGLWGGLWCLPSITMDVCPINYVETSYHLKTDIPQELINISHSFSHFHLQIKALSLLTHTSTHSVAEYPGRWFKPDEISNLGLAKPISMIINFFMQRG